MTRLLRAGSTQRSSISREKRRLGRLEKFAVEVLAEGGREAALLFLDELGVDIIRVVNGGFDVAKNFIVNFGAVGEFDGVLFAAGAALRDFQGGGVGDDFFDEDAGAVLAIEDDEDSDLGLLMA